MLTKPAARRPKLLSPKASSEGTIRKEEDAKSVTLRVHPRIAKKVFEGKAEQLASLEERYGAALKILPGEDLHFEQIVEEIS